MEKDRGSFWKVDTGNPLSLVPVLDKEDFADSLDDGKFDHETESGTGQHQMKKEVQVDG